MKSQLQKIFNDIRAGRNIEVYITISGAIVIAVLSFFEVADFCKVIRWHISNLGLTHLWNARGKKRFS